MKKTLLVGLVIIGAISFGAQKRKSIQKNTKIKSTKSVKIGSEKAKKIALSRVKGATTAHIVEFKSDKDSYDGVIRFNGIDYEFEINAFTGTITDWDVDRD